MSPAPDILIIEDNILFAQSLEPLLARLRPGCTTRLVHTLADGEAAIAERVPDILLLDLGLPDAAGLPVLDRAVAAASQATIGIISAQDDARLIRETFNRGAHGYMPKSRHIDEFEDALRKFLDNGFYIPPDVVAP